MRHFSSRTIEPRRQTRRRLLAALLAIAVPLVLAAIVVLATPARRVRQLHASFGSEPTFAAQTKPQAVKARARVVLRIVPAHSGIARVFVHGPPRREIALTFDDGLCTSCVARIIETLARTGAAATIFPNGRYSRSWDPVAATIRRLVAAGRLTIGDHTFLHDDPLEESPAAFRADLKNDESWIERTFGVSARPFFRPPYGAYDRQTVAVAGALGFTQVIMWSGSVADSSPRTVDYVLAAIRYWAHPGAIILMHGNYPATAIALPQILEILHQRGLRPVTLAQLLGA